jgi:hypothetical protein
MLKTVSTSNGLVSPTFSGNVTLSTGNLVIGTSGKGIDFSSTPGTGTSELLSDYEEGTWTATITLGGGAVGVTYTSNTGYYTKIGRQVTALISLVLSNKGSSTGNLAINGLPFLDAYGAGANPFSINIGGTGITSSLFCNINGTSVFPRMQAASGIFTALTDANLTNTADMRFVVTYFV